MSQKRSFAKQSIKVSEEDTARASSRRRAASQGGWEVFLGTGEPLTEAPPARVSTDGSQGSLAGGEEPTAQRKPDPPSAKPQQRLNLGLLRHQYSC